MHACVHDAALQMQSLGLSAADFSVLTVAYKPTRGVPLEH